MLLTTFIIDYKVVLTAECKASDKLDMNKIMFLPASFPRPSNCFEDSHRQKIFYVSIYSIPT